MANSCKYYKQKKQFSINSGQTWQDVTPFEYRRGSFIEADSPDCREGTLISRWITVPDAFVCDGKDKYEKRVGQYSLDNGATWQYYCPSLYDFGNLIEKNADVCNNKWEGYYERSGGTKTLCPQGYRYVEGRGCEPLPPRPTFNGLIDPVKYVRCSSSTSTILTSGDTVYDAGAVVIPELGIGDLYVLYEGIIGDCVTSIEPDAFQGQTMIKIKKITIGNNVTSIPSNTFKNCSGLTSVTIGSGVTSMGNDVFYRCSSLTSINIPNSVTSIGAYAFYNCTHLRSVNIPSGVTNIDNATFQYCTSLTSITIPSGVTSIARNAFADCYNLTSITCLATTPPTLGSSAFTYTNNCPIYVPCESLDTYKSTSVWRLYASRIYGLPPCAQYRWVESGTTCIGYDKYQNNIKQVSTDGINWENVVPAEYSASTLIETHSEDCGYVPSPKWIATYTGGTTSSAECSSSNAITQNEVDLTDLTSVEIGDCVSTLGFRAFKQAESLTSVTMADTVTLISGETFAVCTALSSVNLSTGLTTISGSSFQNCPSLTSVTIPASVQRIGSRVFERCSGLTSVTVLATTPPSLASYVFDDTNNCPIIVPCDSVNAYKSASGWSTYASRIVGDCPFSGKWLATYSDSHTESATCDSSSAITNNEITKSGLTSVEIGNCVTSISSSAFTSATTLSAVTIPNSVTSIGQYAFYRCSGLTNIEIPNTVTSIGVYAFNSCSGLTSVTIPDSVTILGTSAFRYCSGLTNVTIGSGVTSIGNYTFGNCSSLTSITIPDSITSISTGVFYYCTGLTSVDIPSGVTSIGQEAFRYCRSLTSVTIPDGVTSIGAAAFNSCTSLSSVTIPDSVTSIDEGAFYYCSGLTGVTVEATTPPTLDGTSVFDSTNNYPIYVPAASVEAYKSATNWSRYASRIQPIT